MKKNFLVVIMLLIFIKLSAQENAFTISGGYSFANIEDSDEKGTGFRINGLYEYIPHAGNFAHGFAISYIGLSAEGTLFAEPVTYKINSWPFYYAPKFMFGTEKFKGYIKGVLGTQFASFKREGNLTTLEDHDFGFYGGGGGGIKLILGDKLFIHAEYEIAWASNAWYGDGWINSAMGGIGIQF
ncbi:MAG: outer membrane beta-barrel protein [Bacteroidales bacterium]